MDWLLIDDEIEMDIWTKHISKKIVKPSRFSPSVLVLSLILGLTNLSCDEETETENISPELFTINASVSPAISTVGIVEWSFDMSPIDSATVEFGLTQEYGMTALVDINEPNHRTLLLGMKPSLDYHFEVCVISNGTLYRSGDILITTGPVINGLAQPNITLSFPENRAGGFIVSGSYNAVIDSESVAYILDADGDCVWWFPAAIPNITRARMTWDGKHMALIPANNNGDDGAIEFVSMDGLWSQVLDLPSSTHDLTPMPDNRIAFISVDKKDQETEPCGKIEALSLDGAREIIYDTSALWQPPCHNNAIRYSATENIFTLSDLVHSQIIGVSMTGEHLWTANQSGDLWEKQHGHQLLDGSLLVFSNLNAEVLEFAFPDALEETLVWSYSSMYTSMLLGDVQRLPNGNTLITYSEDGIIQEISGNGEPVQTFAFSQQVPGYVSWRSSLYGPPDDVFQ
jgi:hypothetical protein